MECVFLLWNLCTLYSVHCTICKCSQCSCFTFFTLYAPPLKQKEQKKVRIFMCFFPYNRQSSSKSNECRVVDHFSKFKRWMQLNVCQCCSHLATLITINVCILFKYWILFAYAMAPMPTFGWYALLLLFLFFLFIAISTFFVFSFIDFLTLQQRSDGKYKQNAYLT